MGTVIDFQQAKAVKIASDALERRMSAERTRSEVIDVINWQAASELHGVRLTGPGGIDDLEF